MAKSFNRTQRVGDQMQRELAQILQQDLGTQLGMISVSAVEVTRDLAHAKVFVSVFNKDPQAVVQLLRKHAASIRFRLAQEMRLRHVPELHFVYDDTLARGARLSALIDAAMDKEDTTKDKNED